MFNKRLLAMVPTAMRYVYAQVLLQWVSLLANIAAMTVIGLYVAAVYAGTPSGSISCAVVLGVAVLAIALRAVCTCAAQSMSRRAAAVAKKTLRQAVYDKLTRLGPAYAECTSTSEAVQMSVEGVEQLEVYFGAYLPQLFYGVVAPITLFITLAPWNLPAAAVLFICVPLIPVSIMAVQRMAKRAVREYWGKYSDLGGMFLENIQGLTTLKIHQADEARHKVMNDEAEGFRRATMRLLSVQLNSVNIMDLLAYGGAAVGIIVVLLQFASGAASLTAAFVIVFLSAEFFIPMRTLGSFFHTAMNGIAAAEKIFDLLDAPEPVEGTEHIDANNCGIVCTGLSYSYDGERTVLKGIDFSARQNCFTAIVGESGSGKSTLAGILSGKNAAYGGTVCIGGTDAKAVSRESLMRSLVTVSFSSYLFKGSIRSNLLMGNPNATDEELYAVLDRCRLGEFVRSLGGLDAPLSEQASNLSGGQRQRLAMARAMLRDASIYIFDEATSNIDAESEEALIELIRELAVSKTIIMISHRLSAVAEADQIYVMEDGRVAECGTHKELLAVSGVYERMWSKQVVFEEYANRAAAVEAVHTERPVSAPARRRSKLSIMGRLVGLVGPLLPYMVLAIVLGVLGFLAAIFLTTFGAYGIMNALSVGSAAHLLPICVLVALCGVLRGPLRYGEQLCNHYIAFKILALIRDKVFGSLRRLAPAKLEGRDKGNLISILTSDIELLEVFYAHTISPVVIAVAVSLVMVCFIGSYAVLLALVALVAYVVIGVLVPACASKSAGERGREFRDHVGDMNTFVLDSLRGLKETLQYGLERKRSLELGERTDKLAGIEAELKRRSGRFAAVTNSLVLAFDVAFVCFALYLSMSGTISFSAAVVCSMAFMSSFGPVIAVANLGSSLQQTFASGARVLDVLDEEPETIDVEDGVDIAFSGVQANKVSFSYTGERILEDISLSICPGRVVNIAGRSGSGKSTFLKLLMRFWDVSEGCIELSGEDIRGINTKSLRNAESYMTQETHLFAGTLRDNLLIARPNATDEQLDEACRQASILDLVERLPLRYNTPVGELGDTLSGGERQRIGLARVFLADAPFVLLDEPTSNLDSLNEAAVLSALEASKGNRTIVLVSHRASTCVFADEVYSVEHGRMS